MGTLNLKDTIYLEKIVGHEMMIKYLAQTVLRVKYIESLERYIMVTDKMVYIFNPEEMKELIDDMREGNRVINFSSLNKVNAKKKAELITDLIMSSAQMGPNTYSAKRLNKVIKLLKQLI